MLPAEVFLSHSSQDREMATRVAETALARTGSRCGSAKRTSSGHNNGTTRSARRSIVAIGSSCFCRPMRYRRNG